MDKKIKNYLKETDRRIQHEKPRCYFCDHKVENKHLFETITITGRIDGKKRRKRVKPLDMWCLNGAMFRINKNHRRWWGFDRRCPLNPYTHTCLVCGRRMCTSKKMCSSCAKSRQYL